MYNVALIGADYIPKRADYIPKLCVFQLNANLKPSYIPRCGIFSVAVAVLYIEMLFLSPDFVIEE